MTSQRFELNYRDIEVLLTFKKIITNNSVKVNRYFRKHIDLFKLFL